MAKLVAIGDSLTQGFQSLAITHVDLSYPAMIARCMGLDFTSFCTPDFTGAGGLPCNLEWIARGIERRLGGHLGPIAWPAAVFDVVTLIDEVEDYWEHGRGSLPGPDALYHNLAVWGFEAGDAYNVTAKVAYDRATGSTKPDWFHPPSESRMRTAWRVLNPSQAAARDTDTQIEAARRIKERDGSIENLIVWLGANNCLATVVELNATRTTGDQPPGPFSDRTLWTPAAFGVEYAELARRIAALGAKNVFVATVPHVTIPPVTRGINQNGARLAVGQTYFDYYARFFADEDTFDPARDPHLTGADARIIDAYVDRYNDTIRGEAAPRGWHVVDACAMLDQLAVRRNHGNPTYDLPAELQDLDVQFIEFAPSGRLRTGGLVSLDGVHPTTCGYSLIAREFVRVMNAETALQLPEPDYAAIREMDTLVSHAPKTLHDIEGMLSFLERRFHISRWTRP